MATNLSLAAKNITNGLTRLQIQNPTKQQTVNHSSVEDKFDSSENSLENAKPNSSGVGKQISYALKRLQESATTITENSAKFEESDKAVEIQISLEAQKLISKNRS